MRVESLSVLKRDGGLLFGTRVVRMFGYGFLAVVLALYRYDRFKGGNREERTEIDAVSIVPARHQITAAGIRAGVYSTPLMWQKLTGGARLDLPVWVAGAANDAAAPGMCTDGRANFTGAGVWLVQSLPIVFDVNYACSPVVGAPTSVFTFKP